MHPFNNLKDLSESLLKAAQEYERIASLIDEELLEVEQDFKGVL